MKHLLVCLVAVLMIATAQAGDDAWAVAVAKAKAQVRARAACDCSPCTCPAGTCRCTNCPCPAEKGCRVAAPLPSEYQQARAEANRLGRPLAVFVGQPARPLEGWVTCSAHLEGVPAVCVVVYRQGSAYLLPGRPSDDEVRQAGLGPAGPVRGAHVGQVYGPGPVAWARGGGC